MHKLLFKPSKGVMKLLLVEDAAQQYKVKGGTQEFCHHMARAIGEDKVLVNHAVTKVCMNTSNSDNSASSSVTVHCVNGKVVRNDLSVRYGNGMAILSG